MPLAWFSTISVIVLMSAWHKHPKIRCSGNIPVFSFTAPFKGLIGRSPINPRLHLVYICVNIGTCPEGAKGKLCSHMACAAPLGSNISDRISCHNSSPLRGAAIPIKGFLLPSLGYIGIIKELINLRIFLKNKLKGLIRNISTELVQKMIFSEKS